MITMTDLHCYECGEAVHVYVGHDTDSVTFMHTWGEDGLLQAAAFLAGNPVADEHNSFRCADCEDAFWAR